MSSNWQQIQTQDGTTARLYPDGSIRNEKGHPIPGTKIPNEGHEITHENAREFHIKRIERGQAVARAAANEAVQRADFRTKYGDEAFLAEMIYAAMETATTPTANQQINAAKFISKAAGYDMDAGADQDRDNESALAALGREAIAQLLARAQQQRESETIRD
jgi:hypothetical protein